MNSSRRAVFFDRDGVLNRSNVVDGKPHAPATLSEFEVYSEARGLLDRLRALDFLLFVVTNQPNVSKGLHAKDEIDAMNRTLSETLNLDEIFVCYHQDSDGCACRKPKPGFLFDAARKYDLQLSACYMVGDRWRDIEAGENAGCTTVWIDRGYREKQPARHGFHTFELVGAVEWIIGRSPCKSGPEYKQESIQKESSR